MPYHDDDLENLDEMKLADLPASFLSFLDAGDCLILKAEDRNDDPENLDDIRSAVFFFFLLHISVIVSNPESKKGGDDE